MKMTTAQRAMAYLRASGMPQTPQQINAFCVAYVVSDLFRDLGDGAASATQHDIEERLFIALQLSAGAAL
jgi:hypothetical protein